MSWTSSCELSIGVCSLSMIRPLIAVSAKLRWRTTTDFVCTCICDSTRDNRLEARRTYDILTKHPGKVVRSIPSLWLMHTVGLSLAQISLLPTLFLYIGIGLNFLLQQFNLILSTSHPYGYARWPNKTLQYSRRFESRPAQAHKMTSKMSSTDVVRYQESVLNLFCMGNSANTPISV